MSTKAYYPRAEIGPGQVGFSKTRSIIEAPFYGNNVIKVNTLKEAYELAKNSPGTVVTDMPVYRGEEFGLEPDAKVLLSTTAPSPAATPPPAASPASPAWTPPPWIRSSWTPCTTPAGRPCITPRCSSVWTPSSW